MQDFQEFQKELLHELSFYSKEEIDFVRLSNDYWMELEDFMTLKELPLHFKLIILHCIYQFLQCLLPRNCLDETRFPYINRDHRRRWYTRIINSMGVTPQYKVSLVLILLL